jgi:hypothetical protein
VAAASAVTASADIAVATTTSTTDPSSRSASPFGGLVGVQQGTAWGSKATALSAEHATVVPNLGRSRGSALGRNWVLPSLGLKFAPQLGRLDRRLD